MIKVNIDKAKEMANTLRKADRDTKMKPLDVMATVPMYAEQAELDRQVIRDENEVVQVKIESVTTEAELKAVIIDAGYIGG